MDRLGSAVESFFSTFMTCAGRSMNLLDDNAPVLLRSYRTREEAEMLVARCPETVIEERAGHRPWVVTVPLRALEEAQRVIQLEKIP